MNRPIHRYLRKLAAYGRSVQVLGKIHARGCPVIPKSLFSRAPYNREHYNEFICWMGRLCPRGARLIIDVGSNHGDFAEAASTLFPEAEIWLFEPLPSLSEELEKRAGRHRKPWMVNRCALGAQESIMELTVDPQRDDIGSLVGFGSAHQENARSPAPSQKIPCQVRSLDSYRGRLPCEKIDLLKIDVEGFEFEVLQGAREVLAKTQAILVEVSLMRGESLEPDRLCKMLALLAGAGMMTEAVVPSWYSVRNPWMPVEFNILARREN